MRCPRLTPLIIIIIIPIFFINFSSLLITKDVNFSQTSCVSATGRGLKATRSIHCGDVILSLPETLLITPATALESAVGDIIKR